MKTQCVSSHLKGLEYKTQGEGGREVEVTARLDSMSLPVLAPGESGSVLRACYQGEERDSCLLLDPVPPGEGS